MLERRNRLRSATIAAALVVGGLALGVAASWPLPKYLTSGVPYTLAAKPAQRIAGMVQGDHLQYIYHLGQLRLAAEGRAPWFRNTYEFAGGYGFTEIYVYFPTALLYWPLSYVSEAFAFNAILLVSFAGTMIAGYGLARAWGADRGGAFCSAVVLTLFPARLASLFGGHPAGSAFFLFPMAWWGLEKSWQTGRAAWGWLAAACVAPLARLDPHYLFYLCLLLPFWLFWKLAEAGTFQHAEPAAASSRKRPLLEALPAVVAALVCGACVHYNQIRLHAIAGFGPQVIALVVFFGLGVAAARWLIARLVEWLGVTDEAFRRQWLMLPWFALWLLGFYFFAGSIDTPRYGIRLVRACVALFFIAHVVFLGIAMHRKLLRPGRVTPPWCRIARLWPAAVGLAVAVAYELYLKAAVFDVSGVQGGRTLQEVRLQSVPPTELFSKAAGNGDFIGWVLPLLVVVGGLALLSGKSGPAADRLERRRFRLSAGLCALGAVLTCGPLLSTYFPLYETLYHFVPFFNFTRATPKYAILTATFGGVAAALVVSALARKPTAALIAPLLLVGALIVDYARVPAVGVSVLPQQNVAYSYVAAHSPNAPLLEIPIWPGDSAYSGVYQYWTLRTKVPTVNGYSPTVPTGYVEHVAWPLYDVNYGRFGPREAALCSELGVRFVNFHEEVFPRKVAEFPAAQSLKMLRLNPRLRLVAEDGPTHLFEILDEPDSRPMPPLPLLTRYVPIDHLKKQVGREIEDADAADGRAWASDGRRGQLFYGPFAVLPTGEYVATFRIRVQSAGPDEAIGTLDVCVESGERVLTQHELRGSTAGYTFVELPFALEGTQVVETRGGFAGTPGSSLALDYVFIESTRPSEAMRIEAEEIFCAPAKLVEDPSASQGFSLKFEERLPPDAPPTEARFVMLDEGTYRVTCVARPTATLVVKAIGAAEAAMRLDVKSGAAPGELATSSAIFRVPSRGVYGVSVEAAPDGLDALDCIVIEPAD
jgi:hypothetical protein